MKFFNTTAPYWGNTTSKIIGYGDERLTARSVKIFTDGMFSITLQYGLQLYSGALRSGGAAVS
jgi:hypothetical protein